MSRIAVTALAALVVIAVSAAAQDEASWQRYPAISPDGRTIAFTYKGDLYLAPAAGGPAVPLTSHPAHDFLPVWSHDGKQIAFASDRYGNFDLFVIPSQGGEARRLTFHSAPDFPYSFSPDDRNILYGAARLDAAENRGYPTASQPELYQVAAAGGRPVQLLTTPAEEVELSRNGRLMLYQDKKGGENTWRKHHTSAIARDIWVYDTQGGTHRRITTFAGEDRSPVFAPGDSALYYLSEEGGSFNIYRMALAGGRAQRVTSFSGVPVRFLSIATDGTLCFGHDGRIYTLAPGGQPRRLAITIAADAKANAERLLSVTNGARELAVSPTGKEVAFTFRGDVFVASVEGGVTKRVTSTPDAETGVEFSLDGKALIYASERGGRWAIFESRRTREAEPYFYASTVLQETPVLANDRQNYQPKYSPDGKEVAFIEDRRTLKVHTLATRQSRTLLTDRQIFSNNPTHHFGWSPDGKWILFDYDVPGLAPTEVGLVRADGTGTIRNLTESGFNDQGATWILGGKGMIWFSNRDGLKSVAQSGSAQQDVYAMFFTKGAWDRFRLSKEDFALVKEAEEKAPKPKVDSTRPKVEEVAIDFDGLEERKARLTIHSSSLGDALVSKDGETLYYLARFERGMNLWTTSLRSRETRMLVTLNANGGAMAWDAEQKNIFLLADGGISKIDPASGKRDAVPLNGEMVFDAAAEREAAFDHVWRKTRDTFYSAGYHGIDWDALRPTYSKYLPHIGNNYEFAEMLAEMLGELNISHSGATYTASSPTDDATGSLGFFPDGGWTGAGVRIAEVMKDGPLDKSGVTVRPGMIIESVDGQVVRPDQDIAQFLNRKAGKNVLLALLDGTARSEVVVKPVTPAEENRLLYARWVRRNREEVERLGNGRLGYIHVPGMNDGAYRTTVEEVLGKFALREGLVVDTRFNSGGDLVADLAMFLSGKAFFNYTTDTRSNGFEPNFRWTKPSVSLANEANYSDGHCYAFAYKDLKLGTLVGMPVPGTCTFAGWEVLQDGIRWGVPGVGVKDVATGRYLENWQTEPDIRVMNDYAVMGRGRDQQLEAAVTALLQAIRR